MTERDGTPRRRVATSGDVEVSTYLEIARGKEGDRVGDQAPPKGVGDGVVIVDFGSQYSRLIARRVRELKVYCEIVSPDASWEQVAHINPRGVILSGGPSSVYDEGASLAPTWVYEGSVPILGICYGMQVLAHQLGGRVAPGLKREYGHAVLHQNKARSPIFTNLPHRIARMDEPRRPDRGASSGVHFPGLHRQLPRGGDGGTGTTSWVSNSIPRWPILSMGIPSWPTSCTRSAAAKVPGPPITS